MKPINKKIKIQKDGPLSVCGAIPMEDQILVPDSEGYSVTWHKGKEYLVNSEYDLCRCGQSKNTPYCDGTHGEIFFDGTETASRKLFLQQIEFPTVGSTLVLTDVVVLCASARFCDRAGGAWDNTRNSEDPEARNIAIQEVWDCPAGRLVLHDKDGNLLEPEFEPSIGLVLDPTIAGQIGPVWVKGGIPIESVDGSTYEIRNRVTLCRCGRSTHKPFCDGKHVDV